MNGCSGILAVVAGTLLGQCAGDTTTCAQLYKEKNTHFINKTIKTVTSYTEIKHSFIHAFKKTSMIQYRGKAEVVSGDTVGCSLELLGLCPEQYLH